MRTNKHVPKKTYEGAKASNLTPIQELQRSVMACLLWEDGFYENGIDAQKRIAELCQRVKADELRDLIQEVFDKQKLRHMPLKLICELLKKEDNQAKYLISKVCTRPDQMTELLSLYWKDKKKPLSKQLQRGLAQAFHNFDEYQLAKYNRDNPIKLRDILFLSHAKPKNKEQQKLFEKLIKDELAIPNTWETKLSSGQDKKKAFAELLNEGKMGTMAILRNIRNMINEGVPRTLICSNLLKGRPVLPFEYLRAYKACPEAKPLIEIAMLEHLKLAHKLQGTTMVFVDVSGSMDYALSKKSDTTLLDAACMFAVLLREWCERGTTISFSNEAKFIPSIYRGFDLAEAISKSQPHDGTYLGHAIVNSLYFANHQKIDQKIDRIIVITDEQSADNIPAIPVEKKYFISLGNYKNELKTDGSWVHIAGFSENVIQYILELEQPSFFSTN